MIEITLRNIIGTIGIIVGVAWIVHYVKPLITNNTYN